MDVKWIPRFMASINLIRSFHSTPASNRYYAEKVASWMEGYRFHRSDPYHRTGLMPRLKDQRKLPIPDYRPANQWSEKKALFGQNDYIDILGNGKLNPVMVSYEVPAWLRGASGNEMQLLLRKLNTFSRGRYRYDFPTKWDSMNKRVRYLYRFLNRKTRN